MEVSLLYFDGCPNWRGTDRNLVELASEFGFRLTRRRVTSAEDAETLEFRGSPTVLVDGVDPFAEEASPVGLACRLYATPDGLRGAPSVAMLRASLGK